jgi:hypothetical protein
VELDAGEAVLIEHGRVHAREPLKPGERVTVLVIAYHGGTAPSLVVQST